MFSHVQDFLDRLQQRLSPPGVAREDPHALQLAAAVLLVEVMRADPELQDSERDAALHALRGTFELDDTELSTLLDHAHETVRAANDFHRFTRLLNERLDTPAKVGLVEAMWRVALADDHLHAFESHLVRRLADLLHVTPGQTNAAKLHAQAAAGQLPWSLGPAHTVIP